MLLKRCCFAPTKAAYKWAFVYPDNDYTLRFPGFIRALRLKHIKKMLKKHFNIMAMTPEETLGLYCFQIAQLMTHSAHWLKQYFLTCSYVTNLLTYCREVQREKKYVYRSITDNLTTYLEYSNHTWISLCILTPCFEVCTVLLRMKLKISEN